MENIWVMIASVVGSVAVFGWLSLVTWTEWQKKKREGELEHERKLKAIEQGQVLPDAEIARAKSAESSSWACALVALFVPLGMAGAGVGTTLAIFANASPSAHIPLLGITWGVVMVVGLCAVTKGLAYAYHLASGREASVNDHAPSQG